ncbi:MAG: cobalamin biosynthesis protein CobW [Candidatus Dactylopiibacterium carminicum]|uniref:Cobalamin biosynthesis protein CobW n=1 Tax=Candidatus Dactylopiibacterium carminicum TaxID=857335 RepID=A0A272ESV3_9RHOO|nr:GTP-binding protein [Candidatus Dactylopiibacterium carminicum]KAF7600737.1 GTP-binding protein [Candidatus Dactylopiibacterium carminicum]PAS93194.1 MAG: cobalamin biosynthesis protein CobW [Candidatus Dactylopiibacterium carminicum]PAS95848.1 MAG: cobalamin biosynthesis protein CobW [Candidatus Dactylopiibacterium carminicum]PAT00744.1 MAG: cobalamin biosynthesis protein CobW [Candidatus Dactylopiibacterium carminicum]
MPSPGRIPVTVLTGFLGAGKTTLLNYILTTEHGHRIAVIENEFGGADVDGALLRQRGEEQVVLMSNGCICCTVREDLVRMLGELAARREAGSLAFDRVLIETTGMADPAPVAQTFFVEPEVVGHFALDAVITLVDAMHGMQQLDRHREARQQAGFADRLLITKVDLVDPVALDLLVARLGSLNQRAPVALAHFGETPLAEILDIDAFSLARVEAIDPAFLLPQQHHHTDDIRSFVIRERRPYDMDRLRFALGGLIDRYGSRMLRYKGVLQLAGFDERIVLQGLHTLMALNLAEAWRTDEARESILVFIGETLPEAEFRRVLHACLLGASERSETTFARVMGLLGGSS